MKSLEELKSFFKSELTPDLKKVDAMRKKIVVKVFIVLALILVAMIAALAGLTSIMGGEEGGYQIYGWYALIGIVGPAIGFVMYYDITGDKRFHVIFKTRVIEQIVRFINPNFTYISHKFIPPNLFVDSKLFTDLPNKYKGDDYVFGDLGYTKIAFSEIHAQRKVKKGDGKKTDMKAIFDGIFFVAITNQKFEGTIILPKNHEFEPEKLGFQSGQFQDVLHPNPDFNKYFKIYSANKDSIYKSFETYREVFDDLASFKSNHKEDIFVSFIGSNIYVAISHQKELFEPRLYTSLLDFKIIQEYYDVMYEPMVMFEKIGMVETHKETEKA